MTGVHQQSRLLLLSAQDRDSLIGRARALLEHPDGGEALSFFELDPHDQERLAVVYPPGDLRPRLATAVERLASTKKNRWQLVNLGVYFGTGLTPGRLAFLFPGEGSLKPGLLREARDRLGPVRDWLEHLDGCYRVGNETPPSHFLHPPAGLGSSGEDLSFDVSHSATLGTVLNLAFYELLNSLGVYPDVLLGHSNGEHAAAMVACMAPSEQRDLICQWLRTVSRAGLELGEPSPPEAMVALSRLAPERIEATLQRFSGTLFLAMDNCPLQQILGGTQDAVEAATPMLIEAGGVCLRLPFRRAYHTPLFAPWADVLERHYAALPLRRPRLPWVSCLDGAPLDADPERIRRTMTAQWTSVVRFRQALEFLYESGVRTFVEVGPQGQLSAFVADTLRGKPHLAISVNNPHRGDLSQLLHFAAAMHVQGIHLNHSVVHALQSPQPTVEASLSTATLLHAQQALIRDTKASMARVTKHCRTPPALSVETFPLPGKGLLGPCPQEADEVSYYLNLDSHPYLLDHSLGRPPHPALAVLSFTTSLAFCVEAARCLRKSNQDVLLEEVEAPHWLALDGGQLDLALRLQPQGGRIACSLRARSRPVAFRAQIAFGCQITAPTLTFRSGTRPQHWTPERFYRDYAFHGPSFQRLQQVTDIGPEGIAAQLRPGQLPGISPGSLAVDPALLDAAGQLVAFWLLEQLGKSPTFGIFPYAAQRVLLKPLPPADSVVTCRGDIRFLGALGTSADFVFYAPDGGVIAVLQGFAQRLIELPEALANRLFGGARLALSHGVNARQRELDLSAWRDRLQPADGIWARALAHWLLAPAELAHWLVNTDIEQLLEWTLIKETALSWARDRNLPVERETQLQLRGQRVLGPGFTLEVALERQGDQRRAWVCEERDV